MMENHKDTTYDIGRLFIFCITFPYKCCLFANINKDIRHTKIHKNISNNFFITASYFNKTRRCIVKTNLVCASLCMYVGLHCYM